MSKCGNCTKWYRLGGTIKGECFKQKKKITFYNDECSVCVKQGELR